jgi:hypothetical protein
MEPQNFTIEIDQDDKGQPFIRLVPKTDLARVFLEQFSKDLGVQNPRSPSGYLRGEASISAGWRDENFAELAIRIKE